jgi:hypothetical protein
VELVSDRKALANMRGMLELVDHGDRIVLHGNVAEAVPVDEELIATQSELPGSRTRLEIRGGRQIGPVQGGFTAQLLERLDRGERAWFDCRGEVRCVDDANAAES